MDNDFTLPNEALAEFKKLYKNRYGVELSDEEAAFRATNLINLYDAVYTDEPIPSDEMLEELEKKKISTN